MHDFSCQHALLLNLLLWWEWLLTSRKITKYSFLFWWMGLLKFICILLVSLNTWTRWFDPICSQPFLLILVELTEDKHRMVQLAIIEFLLYWRVSWVLAFAMTDLMLLYAISVLPSWINTLYTEGFHSYVLAICSLCMSI